MSVLVLGDGLLATEIVKQSNFNYISRKKDGFDIKDKSTYHLMTKVEFGAIQYCPYKVIINTIAHTDTYSNNKKDHWNVNYKGVSDLVDFCNNWKIKLVHIVTDYIYSNSPEEKFKKFASCKEDIFILGNTHHQMNIEKYSKIILNPGSVGQARDIKGKAAWATLDKKNFKVDFFYEKYNKEKLLQLVKKIEQQNHYNYRALI